MSRGVTEAMVEAFQAKYREIATRCNWGSSWPAEEAVQELLTAALAAEPGAADMVPVPVEPAVQQIDACLDAAAAGKLGGKGWEELYRQVYRIMIAAAPHQSGESGK